MYEIYMMHTREQLEAMTADQLLSLCQKMTLNQENCKSAICIADILWKRAIKAANPFNAMVEPELSETDREELIKFAADLGYKPFEILSEQSPAEKAHRPARANARPLSFFVEGAKRVVTFTDGEISEQEECARHLRNIGYDNYNFKFCNLPRVSESLKWLKAQNWPC